MMIIISGSSSGSNLIPKGMNCLDRLKEGKFSALPFCNQIVYRSVSYLDFAQNKGALFSSLLKKTPSAFCTTFVSCTFCGNSLFGNGKRCLATGLGSSARKEHDRQIISHFS